MNQSSKYRFTLTTPMIIRGLPNGRVVFAGVAYEDPIPVIGDEDALVLGRIIVDPITILASNKFSGMSIGDILKLHYNWVGNWERLILRGPFNMDDKLGTGEKE